MLVIDSKVNDVEGNCKPEGGHTQNGTNVKINILTTIDGLREDVPIRVYFLTN